MKNECPCSLRGERQPGWLRGNPHGVTGLPAGGGVGVGVGVEGGGRGWGERAGDLHTHPFPGFRSKQRRRLSTCTPPVHRPAGKKNDFEPMLIYPSGNFYYAFCYF